MTQHRWAREGLSAAPGLSKFNMIWTCTNLQSISAPTGIAVAMAAEAADLTLIDYAVSLWRSFISGPILVVILPVLHFIDKLLDRVPIIRHEVIHQNINKDVRETIANLF